MKIIDCFSDICPIPILKIEQELKSIEIGQSFMVIIAHSCTLETIRNNYLDKKHSVIIDEVMNGVWEVTITKRV